MSQAAATIPHNRVKRFVSGSLHTCDLYVIYCMYFPEIYLLNCGYYLGSDNDPFAIVGEGAVVVS